MLEELKDSDLAIFEKVRLQIVEGTSGDASDAAAGDGGDGGDDDE